MLFVRDKSCSLEEPLRTTHRLESGRLVLDNISYLSNVNNRYIAVSNTYSMSGNSSVFIINIIYIKIETKIIQC